MIQFLFLCFIFFLLSLISEVIALVMQASVLKLILEALMGTIVAVLSKALTIDNINDKISNFFKGLFKHLKKRTLFYLVLTAAMLLVSFSWPLTRASLGSRKNPDFVTFIVDNSGSMGCYSDKKADSDCSGSNNSKISESINWIRKEVNDLEFKFERISLIEIGGFTPAVEEGTCHLNTLVDIGIHPASKILDGLEKIKPNKSGASDIGGAIVKAYKDISEVIEAGNLQSTTKKIIIVSDLSQSCEGGTKIDTVVTTLEKLGFKTDKEDRKLEDIHLLTLNYNRPSGFIPYHKFAKMSFLKLYDIAQKNSVRQQLEKYGANLIDIDSPERLKNITVNNIEYHSEIDFLSSMRKIPFLRIAPFAFIMLSLFLAHSTLIDPITVEPVQKLILSLFLTPDLKPYYGSHQNREIIEAAKPRMNSTQATVPLQNLSYSPRTLIQELQQSINPSDSIDIDREPGEADFIFLSINNPERKDEYYFKLHLVMLEEYNRRPQFRNTAAHVCSLYRESGSFEHAPWAKMLDKYRASDLSQYYSLSNVIEGIEINPYRDNQPVEYLLIVDNDDYRSSFEKNLVSIIIIINKSGKVYKLSCPNVHKASSWHVCTLSFPSSVVCPINQVGERP